MRKYLLAFLPIVLGLSIGIWMGNERLHAQSASTNLTSNGSLSTAGSAPTLSACGSIPTIRGNNYGGIVTTGSGALASCTLTFVPAFATAPSCTVSTGPIEALGATATTTTLVVTGTDITSQVIMYHCVQVP